MKDILLVLYEVGRPLVNGVSLFFAGLGLWEARNIFLCSQYEK